MINYQKQNFCQRSNISPFETIEIVSKHIEQDRIGSIELRGQEVFLFVNIREWIYKNEKLVA